MKKSKIIIWLFCLFVTTALFYLMNQATAPPDSSNGNGNPALLIIYMAYPIAIGFYFITISIVVNISQKYRRLSLILLGFSIGLSIILSYQINHKAQFIREAIALSPNRDYQYGWNQFTNSIYFNPYTFLLIICICMVIGVLVGLVKKTKRQD